tara:strand:+ start:220 stop:522 length:303 start_codon:yes stop_codon:yes gene_type:complete
MNTYEFKKLVEKEIIPRILETRDQGGREYASAENIFEDFEKVENFTGIPPEKVIMVHLLKHIGGIGNYLNGVTKQRDTIEGRITDAIVYLFLLWALIKEK